MAKLIYATPMSMDGYLGRDDYDWSNPGDDGHVFFTEVLRPIGTYLYGRKMYETMAVWETPEVIPGLNSIEKDFANVWQAADKIIYSKTLKTVPSKKTRIESDFDPKAIRDLKAHSKKDITIGGANLAAQAIRLGLVDEYQFFVVPMLLGKGIAVLPTDVRIELELLEERRFGNGWVYLRYKTQL